MVLRKLPNPNSNDYRQALERAKGDLAEAIQNRDYWNLRIIQAQDAVRSNTAMLLNAEIAEAQEQEMQKQVGISQAIEAVVNVAPHPLTFAQVREGLNFYGYNIEGYKNPISLIIQTLGRLSKAGRIKMLPDGSYTRNDFYQQLLNAK
jgi:hypothetical protein